MANANIIINSNNNFSIGGANANINPCIGGSGTTITIDPNQIATGITFNYWQGLYNNDDVLAPSYPKISLDVQDNNKLFILSLLLYGEDIFHKINSSYIEFAGNVKFRKIVFYEIASKNWVLFWNDESQFHKSNHKNFKSLLKTIKNFTD